METYQNEKLLSSQEDIQKAFLANYLELMQIGVSKYYRTFYTLKAYLI